MSLTTYFRRLEHADYLIRRRATGNLTTLAKKLNLSKSHTVAFLKQMKDHGFPIKYCRKTDCYYYTEEGSLVRSLFQKNTTDNIRELSKNDLNKISGGKIISPFFLHSDYIRMSECNFILLNQ